MLKRKLTIFTLCTLTCFLFFFPQPTLSSSQIKKRKPTEAKKSTAKKTPTNLYTTETLSLGTSKLPQNYYGTDIIQLYETLEKKIGRKDQFETTSEYVARIDSAVGEEIYAFRAEIPGPISGPSFSYSADDQLLHMALINQALGSLDISSFNSRTTEKLTVFSLKLKVTATTEALYAISTYNRNAWIPMLRLTASLRPDHARIVVPNLAVLFVCKLKRAEIAPLLIFETLHTGKDTYIKRKCIGVEILEVWIYDTASGEIVKREKVNYEPPFKYLPGSRYVNMPIDTEPSLIHAVTGERHKLEVGKIIMDTWRIDEIGDVTVKLTNLQSGIKHTIIIELGSRR